VKPPALEPLQLLMQREQQQCDQAQAALHRADEATGRARLQHEQLLAYRGEYEQRWTRQFAQGGSMDLLHCYRSFMLRLDQALAMQARQVELAERQCEHARQLLLECERRAASVRKLIERRLSELAQAGRQRDQKLSDEQAQRMRWHPSLPGRLLPH
jgi:flagellar FliJ protein